MTYRFSPQTSLLPMLLAMFGGKCSQELLILRQVNDFRHVR